ncbi:uncharacterized protein LOC129601157 [Paramacrobiotus metropolitanus]|uniref:uncharacterized protein LOC129601157 n=1 Tax=Paramacrobiotus metropolitanus TaxID=2943436 RepID=UPI0024463DA3|nr:uncharacterized protein LOC129601157 [Paramacrobiotus metropolitanus]
MDVAVSDADQRFFADLVKRRIVEELSSGVHAIQQQLARDQSAVVSDELGENLCSLIEAVLLHGQLPNSWTVKLSSAFGISKSSLLENTNFWPVVSTVCHRDVLQRINFARSVRTDVSRCRVWLRLALNDSLFESYLHAIVSNEELTRTFYQPWAFLRDPEMLDIVSGHLLGLQNFAFCLSIDKDLNRWDRRALLLAGLLPDPENQKHNQPPSDHATPSPPEPPCSPPDLPDTASDGETTIIPTRTRNGTVLRPRAQSSPLPPPQPLADLPLPPKIITTEHLDEELEAILKITTVDSMATVRRDEEEMHRQSPASLPLPIGRPLRERAEVEEEGADAESNHSGSNLVGKHTGWSSSYDDADVVPSPRSVRKKRAATHESFDAVQERSVAITPGFSSSLGIGSSQFAQMIDAFQSDSSSAGTPTASQYDMSPGDFEHDFEILSPDYVISTKSIEGKKRELLVKIPLEKGLRAQHYKCGACGRPIGMLYGKSRLCHFDRLYYCLDCHVDNESVIPSLIIHNWDFRKYKVCSRAKELIDAVETTPLFDLKELNPKLYTYIAQMEEAQHYRIQLQIVKSYLWTCKKDVCEQFNQRLWPHDHLHESIHVYSLLDLLMTRNGSLIPKMKTAIQFGIDHVRKCFLCSQRGFICEVCRVGEVLHAFDTKDNYQCSKCYAVFHKRCMNATKPCPKCQRKMLHAQWRAKIGSQE